ncbi:MAG: LPPG:FO 2-phospho-L-lactate transferase [Gammaproteobacteria bacterium]|jgi:LPPG:FO 2-phospho-L-lactate transferase
MNNGSEKYLALSGGIGGAKLALGLSHSLDPSQLTVIANTGDDFEHLGLNISPDIDTLLYTLADMNNIELGWGRKDETWNFADACTQVGLDTWFRLGDKDLAVHVYRTQRLKEGASLSQVIKELCLRFSVSTNIVPMSDMPVRTLIESDIGTLSFQEYFVKNRCEPKVRKIRFEGTDEATLAPAFLDCLEDDELQAIIICPSNPFLSVQPILSLPGLKERIKSSAKPVIVVSPIVNGQSIKGPTAKLMQELNLACNVGTIAELYQDIATAIVIDEQDESSINGIASMGLKVHRTNIVMTKLEDKIKLAQDLIKFSHSM